MTLTANVNTQYREGDQPQYISLSFGKTNYLVPQSSIVAIETLSDVNFEKAGDNVSPCLSYNNSKLPLYRLSEQLDIERSISSTKTICIILEYQGRRIALMCTEATPFKYDITKITPLPECMRARPNPIESVCLCKIGDDSAVYFVISATALFKYIDQCST